MKKLRLVLMALLAVLLFANGAYCTEGDELSTNNFRVDGNGQVFMRRLVEVAITNDTITAAESGKVFVVTADSGYIEFTLPTAVAGLTYTIVSINGNASTGQYDGRIYIDPAITDAIHGCITSDSGQTMDAGDSIFSAGSTGDAVTLISPAVNYWVCTNPIPVGGWTDGGTAP